MPRRFSAAERRALLADFRSSGMTQPGFATARGLSVYTLRGWLYDKRAERPIVVPERPFLEVHAHGEPPEAPAKFSLQIGDGPRLTFELRPDPVWLARFVGALPC